MNIFYLEKKGAYKGMGVFLVPNKTNLSDSKVVGKENTKIFKFSQEGIFVNCKNSISFDDNFKFKLDHAK